MATVSNSLIIKSGQTGNSASGVLGPLSASQYGIATISNGNALSLAGAVVFTATGTTTVTVYIPPSVTYSFNGTGSWSIAIFENFT